MKYTVVLESAIPEDTRAALEGQLSSQFGLASEQAQKLASRRTGRLLKPTTLQRAETLLGVYQGLGLQARLQEVEDEAEPQLVGVAAPVSSVAAPELAAGLPSAPSVDPAWSDFAGSLDLPGEREETTFGSAPELASASLPAHTDEPAEPSAARQPTLTRMTEVPDSASSTEARSSLSRRITLASLLPLIVTGAVTVGLLALVLPDSQTTLIRQGANAVAAAVGTSVDVTDQQKVDNQLLALVQQESVGFVEVVTPDGLNFFRSKNAASDPILLTKVDSWLKTHPTDSSFVFTNSPAEGLRQQIQQLKDAGLANDSAAVVQLQDQLKTAGNTSTTYHYEVVRRGVYQVGEQRLAKPLGSEKTQPLYTISVGVVSDESRAITLRTLLLIFGVVLLAIVVAIFVATRTARRVVAPIERLVKAADAISLGQLDTAVRAERNDEIGDLAQALERMRLSLDAAMSRLRRRRGGR